MNKLGLASLDDLELSDATLTAGFWKPQEMLTRTSVIPPASSSVAVRCIASGVMLAQSVAAKSGIIVKIAHVLMQSMTNPTAFLLEHTALSSYIAPSEIECMVK